MTSFFLPEPKTFMFFLSLFAFVMSLVAFVSIRTLPRKIDGMGFWSVAMFVLGLAFLCFLIRGQTNAFVGHFLSNFFTILSSACIVTAYMQFFNYKDKIMPVWVFNFIFMTGLLVDFINTGDTISTNRIFIAGFPAGMNMFFSVIMLVYANKKRKMYATYIPIIASSLVSLALFIRIFKLLIGQGETASLVVTNPTQIMLYVTAVITTVASSIGFVLMSTERLGYEIVDQTSKAQNTRQFAALGEMAGGIAHEIYNPLAIVSGNLELIDMQLKGKDHYDERLQRKIEGSQTAVNRIVKIIKTLRLFTQQSDQDPMVATNVSQIIENTLSFCNEKLKTEGYTLVINEVPDVYILCQPFQITQVLLNLINNAHEALRENTHFEKKIYLDLSKNQNYLEIKITNASSPLSKEVRDRIFQPFFTTKPQGRGTGLGLSTSRQIIEKHSGQIKLAETKGYITFIIDIPTISNS